MISKIEQIQDAVNSYINVNFDEFKRNIPKYSNYVIDHSEIIYALKGVSVEFREDPHYSNKVVKDIDINIEHEDGGKNFRFTGIGNLTIRIDLNVHSESLNVNDLTISEIVLNNITQYFKYFGIKTNYSFFCADSEIYFMDEPIGGEDLFDYENYPWGDIENDENPNWVVVESLQESATTNIKGRRVVINNDGTLSIEDNKGQMVKIRLYVKLLGDINVAKMEMKSDGLHMTGRNGRTEVIKSSTINDVILFVDTGKPDVLDSGNAFKPNISLKKV